MTLGKENLQARFGSADKASRGPMKPGLDPMDREHDVLLALIADVERMIATAAPAELQRQAFAAMVDCTISHFRSEEHWMEICGYPGLPVHKKEHQEVTMWLTHLLEDLNENATESISPDTCAATVEFFHVWVEHHLKQLDAPAALYISKATQGGEIREAVP